MLDESFEENRCRHYEQPDLTRAMEALQIGAKTEGVNTARPFGQRDGHSSGSGGGSDGDGDGDSEDGSEDCSSSDESRSTSPPTAAHCCHPTALARFTQRPPTPQHHGSGCG